MPADETKPDRVVLRPRLPRVAFVFDFDETLAPNTTDARLDHLGVDPERFRDLRVEPWSRPVEAAAGRFGRRLGLRVRHA